MTATPSPLPPDADRRRRRTGRAAFGQPLPLASGGLLPGFEIAYETYGTLSAARDNAILVCHGMTSNQDAAGHDSERNQAGWWEIGIGPGLMLDTDRYFIVCSNVLGGSGGATAPRSIEPAPGLPCAMSPFPGARPRPGSPWRHNGATGAGGRRQMSEMIRKSVHEGRVVRRVVGIGGPVGKGAAGGGADDPGERGEQALPQLGGSRVVVGDGAELGGTEGAETTADGAARREFERRGRMDDL